MGNICGHTPDGGKPANIWSQMMGIEGIACIETQETLVWKGGGGNIRWQMAGNVPCGVVMTLAFVQQLPQTQNDVSSVDPIY